MFRACVVVYRSTRLSRTSIRCLNYIVKGCMRDFSEPFPCEYSAQSKNFVRSFQAFPFNAKSDRIHSTDIAFKPAESGWGANSKYTNNFDKIFAKKDAQIINDDGKRHDDGEGGAKSIDEQKAE